MAVNVFTFLDTGRIIAAGVAVSSLEIVLSSLTRHRSASSRIPMLLNLIKVDVLLLNHCAKTRNTSLPSEC